MSFLTLSIAQRTSRCTWNLSAISVAFGNIVYRQNEKGRHVHYNIANPSSLRFRIAKKITYNPVCITSWQNVDELIVFYVCNADLILCP